MEIRDEIKKLIEVFKVANDDVIGNVARQTLNLNWKEGLSARNQAHKVLDELALTGQIKKGKSFYSVNGYQGEYQEHDKLVTQIISQLILLNRPLTVHREVSFPIGIRSDIVILIKKNGKAANAVIEVCNNESDSYFAQKVVTWKNWQQANEHLSQLFNTPIPSFSVVAYGKSHPDVIDFNDFIKEII